MGKDCFSNVSRFIEMKQVVVIFCVALLLLSCQKDMNKPNPFIEQSKMEDILYDMALLYGMQATNSFATDTVKTIQVNDVFEKYQIDSLTFTTNNRYYVMLKKGVYLDMQNRVMDRLKKEKERIDSLLPKKEIELKPIHVATDSLPIQEVLYKEESKPAIKNKAVNQSKIKEISPKTKKRLLEQIEM